METPNPSQAKQINTINLSLKKLAKHIEGHEIKITRTVKNAEIVEFEIPHVSLAFSDKIEQIIGEYCMDRQYHYDNNRKIVMTVQTKYASLIEQKINDYICRDLKIEKQKAQQKIEEQLQRSEEADKREYEKMLKQREIEEMETQRLKMERRKPSYYCEQVYHAKKPTCPYPEYKRRQLLKEAQKNGNEL